MIVRIDWLVKSMTLLIYYDIKPLRSAKLLHCLNKCVADGPDNMPSLRLYEGDLNGVMSLIRKLIEKMDGHKKAISNLTGGLRDIQSKVSRVPLLPPQRVASVYVAEDVQAGSCLLYTSPSPRDS